MAIVKQRAALVAVYGVLGLVFALVARGGSLAPEAVAVFLGTLWLGFVLAISLMEAWIKFRAPFLPRHIGLDVGRTVFAGLNAVECGLAFGLVVLHAVATFEQREATAVGLLIALVVVFLVEVAWISPKLQIRGDYIIVEQLRQQPESAFSHEQRILRDEMQQTVQKHANPSMLFHIAYVLGEVIKVVLLMVYVIHFLRRLTKHQ